MQSLLESATAPERAPLIKSAKLDESKGDPQWAVLRERSQQRMTSLDTMRLSWWQHWAELAAYILPRRYQWLVTPNRTNRGSPINQNIVDATGTVAARTLASGLMSGLTSPTRPWFRLAVPNSELMELRSVKVWLAEVESRMYTVMSRSNFYDAIATMYFDMVVFGSGPMIIYDDYETVIRCYNPCAGEYYLAASAALRLDTLGRKFTLTVSQIVEMFGLDNVGDSVADAYRQGGASAESERVVAHLIEPNLAVSLKDGGSYYPVPKHFKYREIYWQFGSSIDKPFAICGFKEDPFIAPRWDVVSNDPYGRSPCMDALPDIMQLQLETKRKMEAIEKQVRPPMLADVSLKNEPTSIVAGGITYVAGLSSAQGMKPVFEVKPDLSGMEKDLAALQARIKSILFNDLFLMISQLDTVRTATEIDARREEKMLQLGPVIERTEGEGLDVAMDRIFAIMNRKNLFPPPPPEIQGMPLQIQYVSMLAQAQRAVATAGIERVFQFAGNLSGVSPGAMDSLDVEEAINKYGTFLNVPPEILRDKKQIQQIQQQRAQRDQQAELLTQTVAGAKGAKDLSETNVGGGINALQMMLGGRNA